MENKIYSINGPVVTIKGKTDLEMMEMVYVGKARLVLHRVDDVIRSRLLGSGEREHVVVHFHAVDALRFHIAFDGEVRVVAGDVVLRNRHGGRGV